MDFVLNKLIERFESKDIAKSSVIPWGSPIPVFGDINASTVATLGLNPSNREFVDMDGNELVGEARRFHTLRSLDLSSWKEIEKDQLKLLTNSFVNYFNFNPYNTWFKKLDEIISGLNCSYYSDMYKSRKACHLDLVPYATSKKWSGLGAMERSVLLKMNGDVLAHLIKGSNIKVLILNGATVVNSLQSISDSRFNMVEVQKISLKRQDGKSIKGYLYTGKIHRISNIDLRKTLHIIGFNHNIQSSFGITRKIQTELKKLVITNSEKAFQ